jgi:hypothetical protein
LTVTYRLGLDQLCPPASDYDIFCRAQQADVLLASFQRAALIFLAGAFVIVLACGTMLVAKPWVHRTRAPGPLT